MKILSPAKINLFLHVLGKRPDGYHELFSLMCCVTLYDEISLQAVGGNMINLECSHPGVPSDATNLAYRAAAVFRRKLDSSQGIDIRLVKNIPIAAGLGGGSGNAASVLLALNTIFDYPFSRQQLMEMGLTLGADVPFFLFDKPALATGIGEKLDPFEGALPYRVLLLYPGFNVSTAQIYENLNLALTKDEKKPTSTHLKLSRFEPAHHLFNDLETVTAETVPEIGVFKKKLLDCGAVGALMSGSGPTVFGLFDDSDTATLAKQSLSCDAELKDIQLFLVDPILESGPKLIDVE
ncbi:MAG: 4-(cytidine 5'-diphospho)-2-C-methyl-D-erythritol kinase [Desulfobacterales bacterium]|nr:4-(cytidine 5'-diphospho)-2-C-methyl-D-erythritol kinase [Desulfobacterales bacterium]